MGEFLITMNLPYVRFGYCPLEKQLKMNPRLRTDQQSEKILYNRQIINIPLLLLEQHLYKRRKVCGISARDYKATEKGNDIQNEINTEDGS